MAAKITTRGQVTVPREVREALRLSAGDTVEFVLNDNGEFVLRKAPAPAPEPELGSRPVHPRAEEQMRRRAAELLALLRRLD